MHGSYFLTALMWRGLVNNVTLATTTHRKMGEMSDGTSTQVKVLKEIFLFLIVVWHKDN